MVGTPRAYQLAAAVPAAAQDGLASAQFAGGARLRGVHPDGMVSERAPVVRLQGLPCVLRRVVSREPAAAGGVDAPEPRWLWEGAVDGPGLAALLRSMMVHGRVPCDVDGLPHRAQAVGCWYDAGRGTVVVELAGGPEPVA
jgi:hypothetical protein